MRDAEGAVDGTVGAYAEDVPDAVPRPPLPAPGTPGAPRVGLVLVSHDGATWLPQVLADLAAQTRAPDLVVAVDTGSRDGSPALLDQALGGDAVVSMPDTTGFPDAVRAGVAELERRADDDLDWVWVLHDDAAPAPTALEELLRASLEHPDVALLGPKLREWPSLRRLLELGVTMSGTGRRETGLERGEYDQGQHDQVRQVLAVHSAGLLVRRDVLAALGGFDPQLPVFANDLDLGWRAAWAGHRTLVVPRAVVFHAEAAHRGLRRTALTGSHTHYAERRAALLTLLANCRARALPFLTVRLALGTLLRVLGFLAVRSAGEALDELAALVSVYARPGQVRAARRRRAAHRTADPAAVRRLLAPPWLPYRHGLDAVGDLVGALANQAQDVAERRRAARIAALPPSERPTRVAVAEDDGPAADSGLVVRLATNPVALVLLVVTALLVVGSRDALSVLGVDGLVGGGLSALPDGAGAWWGMHLETWHPLGQGTTVPAPAYVLPLALVTTLLGGSTATLAVAVVLLALPLALAGAWRFLRLLGRLAHPSGAPRWLLAWGATTYAVLPATTGLLTAGRFGALATAVVLPWLAHAATGFGDPEADRRWRAAWRTGLLLALAAAFTPLAWWCAALGVGVLLGARRLVPAAVPALGALDPRPVLLALAVPLGLLLPWWLPLVLRGRAVPLLLEAGRQPVPGVDTLGLLAGRLGTGTADLGAPVWTGVLLGLLAAAALLVRQSRGPVLVCWVVAAGAVAVAAVLGQLTLSLPRQQVGPSLTVPLLLVQAAAVVAVVLAVLGVARPTEVATGRRRRAGLVLGGVLAAAGLLVPVVGLGWFAAGGATLRTDERDPGIPAYMTQRAALGAQHGVLVLRGSVGDGLTWTVYRDDGMTVGEDEVLAATPVDPGLAATVAQLTSNPTEAVVGRLVSAGIEYVVMPAPADGRVAARLDATGGLVQASAADRATRAWQTERTPVAGVLQADGAPRPLAVVVHVTLVVLQAVLVLVALVQAAPTRAGSRSGRDRSRPGGRRTRGPRRRTATEPARGGQA